MPLDLGALTGARTLLSAFALGVGLIGGATAGSAAEVAEFTVEIKDHKFSPAEIKVPAATPVKLTVKNSDATAEEFESHPLGVEKVIAGNASVTIRLKPLDKGSYTFVGEYHEDTAKGTLIAE
ncbi:MAG: cupredoxin domain-containing protein [Hyphomicrobium sp.]